MSWRPCPEGTRRTVVVAVSSGLYFLVMAWAVTAFWDDRSDNHIIIQRFLGLNNNTTTVQQHHHSVYSEQHKPLLPLSGADYWGFGLAVMGLILAAGGGIGGGGMLVPIYSLVSQFSPKHAIPLSNVTVLGGAVANTILNIRKHHPTMPERPLIDWDLILVMEPLTIAGALIGALLNKVLPELLLTCLLVLLLSLTAYNTLTKATKLYKAETVALQRQSGQRPDGTVESELTRLSQKQQEQEEEDDDDEEEEEDSDEQVDDQNNEPQDEDDTTLLPDSSKRIDDVEQPQAVPLRTKEQERILAQILQDEQEKFPRTNLQILVTLFVVVLVMNLLKGGGAFQSPVGISCGSTSFWMANGAILLWILAVSWHCRHYLLLKYRQKQDCKYVYQSSDIQWDERATVVYPLVCCCAGFFAGMFGIGGGIVKGPLMLAMGVHPAVSSASSACMILFTSFTATTSFIVFGLLVPDYAVICFVIGLTATFVGQIGLSYLMRRAQRNSYIAYSIGAVVLLSAFLMTIQSLLSMAAGEQHHSGGICGKGD